MTMTDSEEKIGNHPVIVVIEPIRYLVLEWRMREVHIPVRKMRALAALDREVDHLGIYDFSWTEKRALEQAGLAYTDLRGGMWPSKQLIEALSE